MRKAVRERLEWEHRHELAQAFQLSPLEALSAMAADDSDVGPPQPEALRLLYLTRSLSIPYRMGGLEDQPVLLVNDIQLCINEEIEVKSRINRIMALQAANNARQRQQQTTRQGRSRAAY